MKKFLALLLVTVMVFGFIPSTTAAAEEVGLTLQEAQQSPGVYVKVGDRFAPVSHQYNGGGEYSFAGIESVKPDTYLAGKDYTARGILFEPNYQISQVPMNAQLVLIGIEEFDMYRIYDTGWTIPYGVRLKSDEHDSINLLDYDMGGIYGTELVQATFETLNGADPLSFQERIVRFRGEESDTGEYGLLNASYNEEFTFGRWQRTNWEEDSFKADKKFFMVSDSDSLSGGYTIEKTKNGYFEINFQMPLLGYYEIVTFSYGGIVEFVDSSDYSNISYDMAILRTRTPEETIENRNKMNDSGFYPHIVISAGYPIAMVDGKEVPMPNGIAPYRTAQAGNSFMVPIRFVTETFGIDVKDTLWDDASKTFTIFHNGKTIQFVGNDDYYRINGVEVQMLTNGVKVYSEIDPSTGSMYIPFRHAGEAFGIADEDITYDASSETAQYNR